MKDEPLERKLRSISWKQWIPYFGMYQASKDLHEGRPSYMDENMGKLIFHGSGVYQAISCSAVVIGTVYGLYQLAEKLF